MDILSKRYVQEDERQSKLKCVIEGDTTQDSDDIKVSTHPSDLDLLVSSMLGYHWDSSINKSSTKNTLNVQKAEHDTKLDSIPLCDSKDTSELISEPENLDRCMSGSDSSEGRSVMSEPQTRSERLRARSHRYVQPQSSLTHSHINTPKSKQSAANLDDDTKKWVTSVQYRLKLHKMFNGLTLENQKQMEHRYYAIVA